MLFTVVRIVLIAAAMLAGFLPAPPSAVSDTSMVATAVKLRRLHLVRPDLIPYPIAYEVVC